MSINYNIYNAGIVLLIVYILHGLALLFLLISFWRKNKIVVLITIIISILCIISDYFYYLYYHNTMLDTISNHIGWSQGRTVERSITWGKNYQYSNFPIIIVSLFFFFLSLFLYRKTPSLKKEIK